MHIIYMQYLTTELPIKSLIISYDCCLQLTAGGAVGRQVAARQRAASEVQRSREIVPFRERNIEAELVQEQSKGQ